MNKAYWKYYIFFSLWIVTDIFWPGFDTKNAEYIAWQLGCVGLFCVSYLVPQIRKSKNMAPALFTIFGLISVFTHKIHPVYLEGLTQAIMFTIAFYSIVNTTETADVAEIKKCIVIIAMVNVVFALGQRFGYKAFFDTDQAIGFIGQKWNFGILCAAAIPLALEWNPITAIPLLIGVLLADKYAIYIPLITVCFLNSEIQAIQKKVLIPVIACLLMSAVVYKTHFFQWGSQFHSTHDGIKSFIHGEYELKVMPRLHHWGVMLHYSFARPIDGWGLNSYPNHVWSKEQPGSVEMHNEWLNIFFEGGLVGFAIVFGWFNYMRKKVHVTYMDGISSSLAIILIASFFHSCLHAPNILFVFVVLLACWEIQHGSWQEIEQSYSA